MFPLNLVDLKSHDHEPWHVGPLNGEERHVLCWIFSLRRDLPQAHAACFFLFPLNLGDLKSHDHETCHVGPLNDEELHGLCGILLFGRVAPQAHAA